MLVTSRCGCFQYCADKKIDKSIQEPHKRPNRMNQYMGFKVKSLSPQLYPRFRYNIIHNSTLALRILYTEIRFRLLLFTHKPLGAYSRKKTQKSSLFSKISDVCYHKNCTTMIKNKIKLSTAMQYSKKLNIRCV